MNAVLFGPPGSGKGTQARAVCQRFAMAHVSTGDLLREAVADQTDLGKQAQAIMAAGKLAPDDLVGGIVRERIARETTANERKSASGGKQRGLLFDGYPRNLEQARYLDACLQDFGARIDVAAALEIAEEELVKRICGRRLCGNEKCGASYNIYSMPPRQEGKCDLCGSDLIQRKDDNEETLRERLAVYSSQTAPILGYYEEKDLLIRVAANGRVSDVRGSLLSGIAAKCGG
ncbi:MAG TPA: adenylate kinase [Sumerlaeia bacterium]|nr:adenylate kinase [Sumerlaeia bacterium]